MPQIMNSTLVTYNIHALNVNSVVRLPRRVFLSRYLVEHNPDFLLLSETCLRNKHRITLKNYNLFRTDATTNMRGTAILVKDSLNCKQLYLPFPTNFEYTAVTLKCGTNKLFIFSIYIHSNKLTNCDDFTKVLGFCSPSDYLIMGGDFNAKHISWQNYNNNPNGRVLNDWLSSTAIINRLTLKTAPAPTRRDATSFSFIDLFLISDNISSNNQVHNFDFESDHTAIATHINLPILEPSTPKYIYDFNSTNWLQVNNQIDNLLNSNMPSLDRNLTLHEIDSFVEFLEKSVLDFVLDSTPKIKARDSYSSKLNSITLKCISLKKSLRRRYFNSGRRDPLIKAQIQRLTVIIQELINKQFNDKLQNELLHMKPGPDIFKKIKKFSAAPKSELPILNNCSDDSNSAELLASHFSNIHNNSPAAASSNLPSPPNTFVTSLLNADSQPLINFSPLCKSDGSSSTDNIAYKQFLNPLKTKQIIRSRKNQKSRGENQISNFILRKMPATFILYLTIILNNCFNTSYFPSSWKKATVIPIPKGTSPTVDPVYYRPISLLSASSKVFEVFIKDKILLFLESNNAAHPHQFGFTKNKSTSQALTRLLEEMHLGFDMGQPSLAVSIDLSKAFDTVWVNGLLFKLHQMGFPGNLVKLILNFLSDRSFRVKFNSAFSNFHEILAGVPQGSILGPTLFNIFISDFPTYAFPNILTLFFADDIIILAHKKHLKSLVKSLSDYLKLIVEYCSLWHISVNFDKCQAILLRKTDTSIAKPFKHLKVPSNIVIPFGHHNIIASNTITYLGVILHSKLSPIPHVNKIIKLVNMAFSRLKNIFYKANISTMVKLLCYKQLIRPIILYAFPGWCHISSYQMTRLRALERKILYKCLPRSASRIRDSFRLIPKRELYKILDNFKRLDEVLIQQFTRFFRNLEFSDLPELSNLTSIEHLNDRFAINNDKFKFKCFPPSFLFLLHLQNKIIVNNRLIFFNRKYNSTDLNDFVYDLLEPD